MPKKVTHDHNSTVDRLLREGTTYHREAKKCLKGKAYFAAAVMQVCVLEASLQAVCSMFPERVKKTTAYQKKKFRYKRDRALEFTLSQLINIARELKWFPPKTILVWDRRTDLAGFVHEVRELRNLLHPGRSARKRKPVKFTKAHFGAIYEIFDVANSWLVHHVQKDLAQRLDREEKRKASQSIVAITSNAQTSTP